MYNLHPYNPLSWYFQYVSHFTSIDSIPPQRNQLKTDYTYGMIDIFMFPSGKISHKQKKNSNATYLNTRLGQPDPHGDLLPHEDVRVVRLREAPFQFVQLSRGKASSMPLLFAIFVGMLVESKRNCSLAWRRPGRTQRQDAQLHLPDPGECCAVRRGHPRRHRRSIRHC